MNVAGEEYQIVVWQVFALPPEGTSGVANTLFVPSGFFCPNTSMDSLATNDFTFAVTTFLHAGEKERARALQLAAQHGYVYQPRKRGSAAKTAAQAKVEGLFVVGDADVSLWLPGQRYYFHPNTAKLRISGMLHKQIDPLIDAMGLTAGESILDCTCGLGTDAIVAAYVTGSTGRVRALEASGPLALLISQGMATYTLADFAALSEAMRRIEVCHIDFTAALRDEPDNSWDVIYFDPMFTETIGAAKGMDVIRRLGKRGSPTFDDLQKARRIARRRVVMKDRLPGHELDRLGFTKSGESRRICYGTLETF